MAKDKIHGAVKSALIKDGWTITADPFLIELGDVDLKADMAAERTIAAERHGTNRCRGKELFGSFANPRLAASAWAI
jgi:hypothetical protein